MVEFFPSRTILFTAFGYSIHWYGVMYALAFWVAYAVLPSLGKRKGLKLSRDAYTMLVVYAALGVLVGGRFGYVLFYRPEYFFTHPLDIIAIWNGGMSSHGGFIGVLIAVWLWGRMYGAHLLEIADIITVPAAIGLALGRVGNFINQELYVGYDAFFDVVSMLCIAILCYYLLRKSKNDGVCIALFIILYSVARFFLETIRVQEWSYTWGLTRGQLLTIPLFVLGMLILHYVRKQDISRSIRQTQS